MREKKDTAILFQVYQKCYQGKTACSGISELFEDGWSWVENKAGERTGVKPPAMGTMSGSARPRFGDVSEDNPASPNISRKFG